MSILGPKQRVFAGLAGIAQALGHAHRLELLEHLGQGERSVQDLAARTGLTVANTSGTYSFFVAPRSSREGARQTGLLPAFGRRHGRRAAARPQSGR